MRAVRGRWLGGLVVGLVVATAAAAEQLPQAEACAVLQRIAAAARQLNYDGIFVYQHGDAVETSRIVHRVDGASEQEKLATLDGPQREVIRSNDELLSYFPEIKTVRSERRGPGRSFPGLLPDQLSAIPTYYHVRKAEVERVAGFDAQALVLEPKDGLRYGHKFWTDIGTGLLLKARMLGERNQVVEQFAFTQLRIGAKLRAEDVKPTFHADQDKWKLERFSSNDARPEDSEWVMTNAPAGFRKVLEMRRSKHSDGPQLLTHIVLTDGLAAVSVFIEPGTARQKANEGPVQHGAINIFTRMLGEQRITVLGETPAATVMQIANSLALKGK
jgi:sigma-E factor negative regulatory protein RseB